MRFFVTFRMDRKTRILRNALHARKDESTLDLLKISRYESTKGTTAFEQNNYFINGEFHWFLTLIIVIV